MPCRLRRKPRKSIMRAQRFFIRHLYFPEAPTACSFNMRHEGPDPHRSPRAALNSTTVPTRKPVGEIPRWKNVNTRSYLMRRPCGASTSAPQSVEGGSNQRINVITIPTNADLLIAFRATSGILAVMASETV